MKINGTTVEPGENKLIRIEMEELPTHTMIHMPVWVFRSKVEGPVLLITAGLHGDETNGTEIIRRMVQARSIQPEVGTVIALPVVNIYGFLHRTRALPDGKDMNRSFPGSRRGSLARRLAYTLMNEVLIHADYTLDFHTGGENRTNYPQVRCEIAHPQLLEMAQAFGAPFIVNSPLIDQSFRKEAWKKKKTVIVYEGGESLRLDEQAILAGIAGTDRLMQHLGLLPGEPEPTESIVILKRSWVRARTAGMFRSLVAPGEKIFKGQILGTLSDPFGEREENIKATQEGYVIGLNNDSVIHAGNALYHIGW